MPALQRLGLTPLEKECPSCHGSGQIGTRTVERESCAKCDGTVRYPPPENLCTVPS